MTYYGDGISKQHNEFSRMILRGVEAERAKSFHWNLNPSMI